MLEFNEYKLYFQNLLDGKDDMLEHSANLPDPAQIIGNDPNPVMIAIYATGFVIAVVWNFYAYYKMFTLEHVKRELAIKKDLRARGLLGPEDD